MDFSKTEMVTPETSLNMSMGAFLASLKLESLREIFDREHINVEILADMGHEDLRQIGITAFGHRCVTCLVTKTTSLDGEKTYIASICLLLDST